MFKQSYKSRALKNTTAILNQKHLIYIATRPGVVCNPDCGFGLWGRLPSSSVSQNINDLKQAKKIVRQASANHTLWRAIISVDDATAKKYDLYSRQTWQSLVDAKINVLAEEMHIKNQNFSWVASMHYVKGHPHVHILYWDASDAIHTEAMSNTRFQIMAERVRAAFSQQIYREELHETQVQQTAERKRLRLELKAMLTEANVAEALDLYHVKAQDMTELQKAFSKLVASIYPQGRMTYAFHQHEVDTFLDQIMEISDFRKQMLLYEKLTLEISRLYGNGPQQQEFELEKAHKKLYNSLGNEVMAAVKQYRLELNRSAPETSDDLYARIRETAVLLLPTVDNYQKLLEAMPRERTPRYILAQDPLIRKLVSTLVNDLAYNMHINAVVYGYIQTAVKSQPSAAADFRNETYRQLFSTLSSVIFNCAEQDAGYPKQAQASTITNLLIRLLGLSSQHAQQAQAQRDLFRARKELSKTAQRDRQRELEHSGSWSPDL